MGLLLTVNQICYKLRLDDRISITTNEVLREDRRKRRENILLKLFLFHEQSKHVQNHPHANPSNVLHTKPASKRSDDLSPIHFQINAEYFIDDNYIFLISHITLIFNYFISVAKSSMQQSLTGYMIFAFGYVIRYMIFHKITQIFEIRSYNFHIFRSVFYTFIHILRR